MRIPTGALTSSDSESDSESELDMMQVAGKDCLSMGWEKPDANKRS